MATIPVVCDDCGTVFVTENLIAFGPAGGAVHMTGNKVGPCPTCQGVGSIPDGTYEAVGGVVTYIAGATASPEHLRRLREVLIDARDRGAAPDETAAAVDEALPGSGLGQVVLDMARSPIAVAYLTLLVALVGILIAHYDATAGQPPAMSPQDVQGVVAAALREAAATPPVTALAAPAAKVGRNDRCPCGSGKKFKRCHGR